MDISHLDIGTFPKDQCVAEYPSCNTGGWSTPWKVNRFMALSTLGVFLLNDPENALAVIDIGQVSNRNGCLLGSMKVVFFKTVQLV